MKSAPQSPSELRNALAAIFPTIPRDFGVEGESVFEQAGSTHHSVMREFAHFFARNIDEFSDRQLRRLAELVVRSVASPGPLANAVETCFLEHTRQLKGNRRIEPFLAAAQDATSR